MMQGNAGSRQTRAFFVWCRGSGDFTVNRTTSPLSSKWAALVLIAASLALASCGRKGGLDLPPNSPAPQASSAAADAAAAEAASKGTVFDPSYGMNADPQAAKGRKRSFILDPLLD